jgi:hypothetical protein
MDFNAQTALAGQLPDTMSIGSGLGNTLVDVYSDLALRIDDYL